MASYCSNVASSLQKNQQKYRRLEVGLHLEPLGRSTAIRRAWDNVTLFSRPTSELLAKILAHDETFENIKKITASEPEKEDIRPPDVAIIVSNLVAMREVATELAKVLEGEINAYHEPPESIGSS